MAVVHHKLSTMSRANVNALTKTVQVNAKEFNAGIPHAAPASVPRARKCQRTAAVQARLSTANLANVSATKLQNANIHTPSMVILALACAPLNDQLNVHQAKSGAKRFASASALIDR